jgi:peptidoglycan/LPS O-acetylase OafA/YrhL
MSQLGTKRVLGLDMVRSIAIFLVVWAHSTYVFSDDTSSFLQMLLPVDLGVPVFFVLSGYLIGGILLRTMDHSDFSMRDLGEFWMRRWFRTLPNYFLVIGFLWIYDTLFFHQASGFSYRYLFFAQNFFDASPDFFPEGWSLSIEEWFYLLFPLCCYFGLKMMSNKKGLILILACIFIIVPTVLRWWSCVSKPFPDVWEGNHIIICRFDSLMYGVVGAYFRRYKPGLWSLVRLPALWVSIVLLIVFAVGKSWFSASSFGLVYYYSLASIIALAALPYFSTLREIKSRRWTGVITFVSITSYAMYVLNLSVIEWRLIPGFLSVTGLKELLGEPGSAILEFVLFWPVTVVGSYLLYRYFEMPWMNLRDRISLARRRPSASL